MLTNGSVKLGAQATKREARRSYCRLNGRNRDRRAASTEDRIQARTRPFLDNSHLEVPRMPVRAAGISNDSEENSPFFLQYVSPCQLSLNMGTTLKKSSLHSGHHHLLHTQPLLLEVFTYALCPRQLSRVISSPHFDLVTSVSHLHRQSHTSLGAATGRS
jgi:hypothetical protein